VLNPKIPAAEERREGMNDEAAVALVHPRRGLLRGAAQIAAAGLVAACFVDFGFGLRALASAVFCCALAAITVTDLERRIVPNRIVAPASVVVLALATAARPSPEWAIAAAVAFLFLLIAALAYPAGLGMGDVKLAFLMGAALGRNVVVALLVGMLAAALLSLGLLVRHGRRARKITFPYAPFLALGSVVALFAGDAIVDWYLRGR
jgi:prepilin signal peptidase PulO-like enzyme (type II secretory pathway)